MEVAVYAVFTAVWWMLSVSVCFPLLLLLKYSKSFQGKWFSWFYVNFVTFFMADKVLPVRKKAFDILKEHLSHRDNSSPLKVLEIGIGPGSNLHFYPENSHLTALDMNASFGSYFKENSKKYPQITLERTVVSMAENMKGVLNSSMDVVICTYLLCSAQNVPEVLKEVKRVLKPGGKFLFLEHVASSHTDWSFFLQRLASPLWKLYFAGCCLHRDTGDRIYEAGFSDVDCRKLQLNSLFLFVRFQIFGVATK